MKKIKEKESVDPDKASSDNETLTRRQALKRIALGAGIGIAGFMLGIRSADASKNCCIQAYPDYGYGNYYSNYYSNSYNNYSYSNHYGNNYVVNYSDHTLGYTNYGDGHNR